MTQTFWQKLAKKVDLNLLSEGIGSAEHTGTIDTGSYTLNMLASGSLFGGIFNNSFVGIAGESATGKTYFALGLGKNFMRSHDDAGVIYADTESAIRRKMAIERGIDDDRITLMEPNTVEDFRTKMLQIMSEYSDLEEKPPMMVVLDSLGNLSTNKEMNDTSTFGETKEAERTRNTKDMTRTGLIKGSFRVLRQKMAFQKVPMIITNHVYDNIGGYGPAKTMGGGSGLKYAADTIWFLTKATAKEGDTSDGDVIGAKITVTNFKARETREKAKVQVLLNFETGLDPYYGLIEMALECGVFKQLPKGLELPGGVKVSRKEVLKNPEQIYTKEILQTIDEAASSDFRYGATDSNYIAPEDESEDE